MSEFTRDGSFSVAGRQLAGEVAAAASAPVTMADANAWAINNRMKPTGDDLKDLQSINRMRKLLRLTPFSIVQPRGPQDVLPDPSFGANDEAVALTADHAPKPAAKPPATKAITPVSKNVPAELSSEERASRPVERSPRGLVEALFDEMDEVRAGRGSEARIKQISQISVRITELMGAEAKFRKLAMDSSRDSRETEE